MKRATHLFAAHCGALLLLGAAAAPSTLAQALPPATNVIARMLERSAQLAQSAPEDKYIYDKRTVIEELDASGNPVKTTEKLYQVTLIQGLPFTRLVKVQGRDLTPAELDKQNQREQRFRKKISARDPKEMAKRNEPMVTRELTDRFAFTVLRREPYEGRPTLVLDFAPNPARPAAHTTQDQILGRLAGRLWVDEQAAELAMLELHLTEPFSMGWWGILGSLKQCELNLRMQRISEDMWALRKQTLLLVGRKLTSTIRFRLTEESTNFRRP